MLEPAAQARIDPAADAGAAMPMLDVGVTGLRGLPDIMGGIERHCEELYPRMLRLAPGLSLRCVARRPYVTRTKAYRYEGIEVVPLPSTKITSLEAIINSALGVLYFGTRRRPGIVHVHGIGPGLVAPLVRLMGLRLVVTHHGKDYRRAKWGRLAKAMLRAGEALSMRFANRVIAVSPSLADELRASFPGRAGRVTYIPNGAPDVSGVAADRAVLDRFGLTPGGYILSVGRLVPEKGFDDLIEAHGRSGSPLPLVIAGGADHEGEYSLGLRAKASDRVLFTGMLPREQVLSLCAQSGAFVLASHHEGLPIAALEAGAMGARMLLSDIDANRDVGLPPAHYYPVGDIDALAARLRAGLDDLARHGDDIARRFDWMRVAEQTLAVYAEEARR